VKVVQINVTRLKFLQRQLKLLACVLRSADDAVHGEAKLGSEKDFLAFPRLLEPGKGGENSVYRYMIRLIIGLPSSDKLLRVVVCIGSIPVIAATSVCSVKNLSYRARDKDV
jgi:hypothetical protein